MAAEVGGFSRFPTARSFMSFVGLVPSEPSSGETVFPGQDHQDGQRPRQDAPRRGVPAPCEALRGPLADGGVRCAGRARPDCRGGHPGKPAPPREARAPQGTRRARQRREHRRGPRARRLRLGAGAGGDLTQTFPGRLPASMARGTAREGSMRSLPGHARS
ncbi:transposase [Olsenella sp. Marseille-P4559]|uniref:transposase n=1 Tax=Olsenella sp. Marseille-P4559 TaxID=2364795 RepID=UPI00352D3A45